MKDADFTKRLRPMMCLVGVGLIAIVALSATPVAIAAEPGLTEAQVEQIQNYFKLAKARRDAKDYEGAIDYLRKAIDVQSEPWLVLALALNYEDAGQDQLALSHYRLCTGASVDDRTRAKALEGIERLEHKATLGWLLIESNPRLVQVAIDAKPVEPGPGRKFELTEGTYLVTVTASGYEPTTHEVRVTRGKTVTIKVALTRMIVAPSKPDKVSPKPLPTPAPAAERPGSGVGTWVVIGAGVALVGGGVVTYLVGDSKHGDVETAQTNAEDGIAPMTRVEAQGLLEDGKTLKTVGIISGSVGLAALITGIVLATTSGGEPNSSVNFVGGPAGAELGLGVRASF